MSKKTQNAGTGTVVDGDPANHPELETHILNTIDNMCFSPKPPSHIDLDKSTSTTFLKSERHKSKLTEVEYSEVPYSQSQDISVSFCDCDLDLDTSSILCSSANAYEHHHRHHRHHHTLNVCHCENTTSEQHAFHFENGDNLGVAASLLTPCHQHHEHGIQSFVGGNLLRNMIRSLKTYTLKNPFQKPQDIQVKQNNIPGMDLYRINICEANNQNVPKRVVFDLINEEQFKPKTTTIGTNTSGISREMRPILSHEPFTVVREGTQKIIDEKPPSVQTVKLLQEDANDQTVYNKPAINYPVNATRIDVYYFDHGNASYLRTSDTPGTIHTEIIAERTQERANHFWAEFFGSFHIGSALVTTFVMQLLRLVFQGFLRPLIVGALQTLGDYLFKPFLVILFNACIQPPMIFIYNCFTTFRDLCEPIAEGIGFFLREFAVVIRSFRIVDVKANQAAGGGKSGV